MILGDDTNILYVTDDTNKGKIWLQTLVIIEEKRQEERLAKLLINKLIYINNSMFNHFIFN